MVDECSINFKEFLRKYIDDNNFCNAENIFNRIHSHCLNVYNTPKLPIILHELLDNAPSLYDIIVSSNKKVSPAVVEKFCDLILNISVSSPESLIVHNCNIKRYLLSVINCQSSKAKMKELALKALQKVVLMCVKVSGTDSEGYDQIIDNLIGMVQSKPTSQVLSALFELLGHLSELFPTLFVDKSSFYEATTLHCLTSEIAKSKPTISLISGCIEGLCCFYKVNPNNQNGFLSLYELLLRVLEMDSSRHAALKSCLHCLSSHWVRLKVELFRDMEKIYHPLLKLCKHHNPEVNNTARRCIDSLLSVVGLHLQEQSNGSLLSTNEIEVFNFLVSKATKTINQNTLTYPTSWELMVLDIKCLGHLARACSTLLPINDLDLVYGVLVDRVWHEYRLEKGEQDRRIDFVNSKIYQISDILISLIKILDGLLTTRQVELTHYDRGVEIISRLTLVLVEFYPQISVYKTTIYRQVIHQLVNILKPHTAILHSILSEIVYQAMIYSCSFPIPPDYNIVQDFSFNINENLKDEITEEDESDMVQTFAALSLREYLPFWDSIFNSDSDRDQTTLLVFDFFVEGSLRLIDRLNLTYSCVTNDNFSDTRNSISDKSACVPKDFEVFVNFCELFQFVMKRGYGQIIDKWASTCIKNFVIKSLQLPLVSGFYKLVCSVLVTLDTTNYFDHQSGNGINNGDQDYEQSRIRDLILDDITTLLLSMLTKMSNYNDELLLSCLTLLVNTPTRILADQNRSLSKQGAIAHLKMAIQLGSYYLPLGHACLDMLCRWIKDMSLVETFLDDILPSFYTLLMFSNTQTTVPDPDDEGNKMKIDHLVSSRRDSRNMERILRFIQEIDRRRLCEELHKDNSGLSDNKLAQLQIRLLRILGELGIAHSRHMITTHNESFTDIGWNRSLNALVSYSVPFVDLKPQIRLEQLLPTISHIALSSNDCQTKSIASEALHAIITVIVGQSSCSPSPKDRERLLPLFSRMFVISLKLATDINKVSNALFSDLLYQLAFWYSYPYNDGFADTNCFIESLFDSIQCPVDEPMNFMATNDTNSGNLQRDLAGRLLRYMLESSLSHSDTGSSYGRTLQLNSIRKFLKKIYNLCHHFSSHKRLGAVFVLNSVYSVLSKNEKLLQNELFMILYSMINCQRLSEADKRTGIFDQLNVAFAHIITSFIQYKDDLITDNCDRKKPPSWTTATIESSVRWLLGLWFTELRCYRKRCISVCRSLIGCNNASDPGALLGALIAESGPMFEETHILLSEPSADNEMVWCGSLEASLTCYSWLLTCKVTGVAQYFSALFTGLNNLLRYHHKMPPSKHVGRLSMAVLHFVPLFLSQCEGVDNLKSVVDLDGLVNFLASFILQPFRFSSEMNDSRRVIKLQSEVSRFLGSSNESFLGLFIEKIWNILNNYGFQSSLLQIKDSTGRDLSPPEIEYLFKLFKQLSLSHPYHSFIDISVQDLISGATIHVDEGHNVNLTNVQLISLDYLINIKDEKFFSHLLELLELNDGTAIYAKFKSTIVQNLRLKPRDLVTRISVKNWPLLIPIVYDLLDLEIKCRIDERIGLIVPEIARNWERIWTPTQHLLNVNMSQLSVVMNLLKKMVALDTKICSNADLLGFFCTILSATNISLEFKNSFIYLFLPFYQASSGNDDHVTNIVASTKVLVVNQLSIQSSSDLTKEFAENIVKNIIECLQVDCDVAFHITWLRSIIVPIVCMDTIPLQEEILRKNISMLCHSCDISDQVRYLSAMLDELRLQNNYTHRDMFLHKFYLLFILEVHETTLTQFFYPQLSSLKDNLQLTAIVVNSEKKLQELFVNLEILCAIYRGLGPLGEKQKIGLRESAIISDLSKSCRAIVDWSTSSSSWLFRIRSSAFSCLCAVVIGTQINDKFFIQLLLKPNRPLFQQLIDNRSFGNFVDQAISDRDRTIEFRSTLSRSLSSTSKIERDNESTNESRHIHIASQFLSDSSLALDVNKLDNIPFQNIKMHNPSSSTRHDDPERSNVIQLRLAVDVVNNHPCMETMIFLLHHMRDLGFIPTTNQVIVAPDVPCWMKVFHDTFIDLGVIVDIKYFISKLILNCYDIFKPYASFWLPGLVKLITSTTFSVAPYLVSLINLVSQWLPLPRAMDGVNKLEIDGLVQFMVTLCSNDNPSINKIVLELYDNIIKSLPGRADIPYRCILDKIQSPETNTLNTTMLRMLFLALSYKFPFMSENSAENNMLLIKPLLKNLKHKSKSIYASTFEVCGMLMVQADIGLRNCLEPELTSSLEFILSRSTSEYVTCVALLTKGSVEFSQSQHNILLSLLKKMVDDDLLKGLEILGSGTVNEEGWCTLSKNLHELNLFDSLQIKSRDLIGRLLQIIHQTILSIAEWHINHQMYSIIMSIFEHCLPCGKHEDKHVRGIFFQLVMDLSAKEPDITNNSSILSSLLLGILDPDKDIAQSVRNFCSSPPRLPTQTLSRATRILEILFPNSSSVSSLLLVNRNKFLALATNLLLEMTSRSPDFNRPLFDKCLDSNTTFEMLSAAEISSQTSRSLLPHFLKTTESATIIPVMSHEQMFKVPLSKNIPLMSKNFDWIKLASSQKLTNEETGMDYSCEWPSSQIPGVEMSMSMLTQSSFLSPTKTKKRNSEDGNMIRDIKEQSIQKRLTKVIQSADVSKTQDSDFYRRRTIASQRRQMKNQITRRNLHRSAVFLYRNYRTGKVPDIQIQNCSLIAPLQMLAQYNDEFATEIFSHLYDKLLLESSLIMTVNDYKNGCDRMTACLNNMLTTSTLNDHQLVSSCLTIAINHSSIIKLPASQIFKAALITNNEVLATVLMEKYLVNESQTFDRSSLISSEPAKKKLRYSDNEEWLTIAPLLMKLYKSLDLNEEIIGLLSLPRSREQNTLFHKFQCALKCDYRGNFKQSFKYYNDMLTDINTRRSNFECEILSVSQEGLINCLKKLSRWSDLTTFLEQSNSYQSNNASLVSKAIIDSKLRFLTENVDKIDVTMTELESLLNTNNVYERDLLMPMEMATFNLLKGDVPKADHYCNLAYNHMLSNIGGCSLLKDAKLKQLQNMQLLYEMSEFINITGVVPASNMSSLQDSNQYLLLLDRWTKRVPDKEQDSVEFWEEFVFYRRLYLELIKKKVSNHTVTIDRCVLDHQLLYIDACIVQRRTSSALNSLSQCRVSSNSLGHEYKVAWSILYGRAWLRSAGIHGRTLDGDDIVELSQSICKSIMNLRKLSRSPDNGYEYNVTIGDCYWTLANVTERHSFPVSEARIFESLVKVVSPGIDTSNPRSIIDDFLRQSFSYLEKLVTNHKSLESDISTSLMVLSDFCDSEISRVDDDATININPCIHPCFIESTLLSMKSGHFSARNKFPRVLQIAALIWDDKCRHLVTDICSTIPSWMFLAWLDQMMTYLFSDKWSLVYPTLWKITLDYPHAIFFPFQLRWRDDSFHSASIDTIRDKLCCLHLMDQFNEALHHMLQPEDYLLRWMDEAGEKLRSVSTECTRNSIIDKYRSIYQNIFGSTQDSVSSSSSTNIQMKGILHKQFVEEFRNDVVNNFQENGEALLSLTTTQFDNICNKLKSKIDEWKSTAAYSEKLIDYSQWLANYNLRHNYQPQTTLNSLDWLEVPGQYNNVCSRPFPEQHVKIFKFDSEIKVINSKQKPKKINIIGDNEQSYKFLVKSGEDLRQDFRLEQMFNVMNVMLSKESQTRSNLRLSRLIVTYNVVPVSKLLGILEWVDNTVVLRDFLQKTMTKDEEKSFMETRAGYYCRFPKNECYNQSWLSDNCEEMNDIFERTQEKIADLDLLRRSFIIISKNHESFYRLRIRFIHQYAIMAAAHYILGIGDRHLNNFLIDESSGEIIGIDFGYSFGVSSIFLAVPELVPFRLTSSLTALMRPAGVGGLFAQTVDSVLTILGDNHTTIMSILHVFVSDQIIDWIKLSRGIRQSCDTFKRKRIGISRRKLLGKSPLSILFEEVGIRNGTLPWFRQFRSYYGRRLSSVECEDSSKQLIAMATDTALLARTYKGWDPLF